MAERENKRSWGGSGTFAGGVGSVTMFAKTHQGGGDLPPGEIYFEGVSRNGDTYVAFKNGKNDGITLRRVDTLLDAKLGEVEFQPGAAASWGAPAGEDGEREVTSWMGPNGAMFQLGVGGQRAFLTPARRN